MLKIKYYDALNEEGDIINICDVTKEDRVNHKFFCLNCVSEMIPKLGKKNAWHFAHKAEVPNCNSETYLHKLAKLLIKKKFYSDGPFEISYWQSVKCSDNSTCPFFNEDVCQERQLKTFDLKKYYDTCQEEQPIGNYIADLKLSCSLDSHRAPIAIEIYVSHKSSKAKVESGIKIIEIKVGGYDDIKALKEGPIIEDGNPNYSFKSTDSKLRFYNFNRDSKISAPLAIRNIPRFYLFKSGAAFVSNMDDMRSCRDCSRKDNANAILELNIDSFYLGSPSPYEIGYVTALNLGFDLKTCQLCKFRKKGYDSPYGTSANFCCLYKKYGTPMNPDSKDAMRCAFYRINDELVKDIQSSLMSITVCVAE